MRRPSCHGAQFAPAPLLAALLLAIGIPLDGLEMPSCHAEDAATGILLPEPIEPPPLRDVRRKRIRETYPDGAVRVERETIVLSDGELLNDGKYVEYYADGQEFAEGQYARGVYDGMWSFWYPNGQLCKQIKFDKGAPEGEWEVYREDGTLLASKVYRDGRRNGKWTQYYEDGKTLKVEQTYADNTLNGTRTSYYRNGKPRQQAELVGGQLNGKIIEWDEAGRKTSEFELVDGKLHGELKRWDADGTESVYYFENGKRVLAKAGPG